MIRQAKKTLYTIGYAGFSSRDDFIKALLNNGINGLIDVRSTPYSAHYSQYDKEPLNYALQSVGIYYRNYAKEFGARQHELIYYRNGRLDFELFARSAPFLSGMARIEKSMEQGFSLALMCAEKEPITCHRAIMVARPFFEKGYNVIHLMPEGTFVTQEILEKDLVDLYFPAKNQLSMFDSAFSDDTALLRLAYKRQNDKIGYREASLYDGIHDRLYQEERRAIL